jgi:hypothetical protein
MDASKRKKRQPLHDYLYRKAAAALLFPILEYIVQG